MSEDPEATAATGPVAVEPEVTATVRLMDGSYYEVAGAVSIGDNGWPRIVGVARLTAPLRGSKGAGMFDGAPLATRAASVAASNRTTITGAWKNVDIMFSPHAVESIERPHRDPTSRRVT